MEGIVLGQYIPGKSFLHNLDPRTKIIVSGLFIWLVFGLEKWIEYFVFGSFIAFLYILAGVTGRLLKILRPGFFLVGFTVIINMIFTPGENLISLGIISVSREGFRQGLVMGMRIIFLISISSLVTLTTSPVRMTQGLELLLKPLKKIGVPVSELAMMMNISIRYIPVFLTEMNRIIKAQASRGADFDSRNIARRIKYITALLVPLFISAFRRADDLAVAMEARGYVVGKERTNLYVLKLGLRDYAVIIISILLFIITKRW